MNYSSQTSTTKSCEPKSESVRSKLINYGCEVNGGADIKKSNISDDYLLKTLEYILQILSGTEQNSNPVSSSSCRNDSVKILLETDDAVNCSFKEGEQSICPLFVPSSHVNLMTSFRPSDSESQTEPCKELLKLLVEHEADVNMAHSDSSEILDSDFLLLKSARKLLFQLGSDVNLHNEEKMFGPSSANKKREAENCTYLKWLMVNPGSQVNNSTNPDNVLQQEVVKLKLRRLIVLLTSPGNELISICNVASNPVENLRTHHYSILTRAVDWKLKTTKNHKITKNSEVWVTLLQDSFKSFASLIGFLPKSSLP